MGIRVMKSKSKSHRKSVKRNQVKGRFHSGNAVPFDKLEMPTIQSAAENSMKEALAQVAKPIGRIQLMESKPTGEIEWSTLSFTNPQESLGKIDPKDDEPTLTTVGDMTKLVLERAKNKFKPKKQIDWVKFFKENQVASTPPFVHTFGNRNRIKQDTNL